jgi:hypothetical protein
MDLQRKTITIAAIEAKNGRVSITDQNGEKYSFFQNKQDKTISKAYESYCDFKLAVNSIIDIGYKENGQYKNIANFYQPDNQSKASAQPFANSRQIQKDNNDREKRKEEGLAWGNAKANASRIVAAQISGGLLTVWDYNSWLGIATEIYNAETPNGESK